MTDRILSAQQQLGRALQRARLVEDRVLARTVRELGERLAHTNHGLLQLVRLHDVSNAAFDRPIEEFRNTLARLIDLLGPVTLVCVEGQIYVNDIRVRFENEPEHAQALEKMLARHRVGGLTYFRALDCDQVRTALKLLAEEPAADRPRGSLQETVNGSGLSSLELLPPFRFVTGGQRSEVTVSQAYNSAAEVLAETFANLQAGRLPNPLPVRRIVNDLLDATTGKDLARIAFEIDTTAPEFARHPLAVTNHALLIGRAIGLAEASLADLGIAAMLHDVGFYGQEDRRPGSYDDHTWIGFRILLRQRGFHEARIRRLLVMIEHHDRHDRPGGSPSLHARIIHIADDYDALTRLRSDSTPALVPADALQAMAAATGAYDPTALQLFLNALGAFPPGSVLRLADGTLVVVLSGVRDPQLFDKPRCKVVRLADGSDPQRELWVDLAKGGRIVEVLGSRLQAAGAELEQPPPPPKPGPPPAPPVFGSPYLRAPRPPKPPKSPQ